MTISYFKKINDCPQDGTQVNSALGQINVIGILAFLKLAEMMTNNQGQIK